MGVGKPTQWKPTGRSTITAHRTNRRSDLSRTEKCCAFVLKRTCSSLCIAAVGFLLLLGVCLLYLPEPVKLELGLVTEEIIPVTLLVWTHPFGRHRKLPDCWEQYQIRGCTITDDVYVYPRADAVIIHHREIASGYADLPWEPRPQAQKWIWMNYESPSHTRNLWLFEGVLNLTMSYRTDSDIFLPYGYLVANERTVGSQSLLAHPLRGPSHHTLRPLLVAWVISNWSESHARVTFYHELRNFIPVDVYGSIGRSLPPGSGSVVRLLRRYLFYLALENSQHTDYITEKLWNAVSAGAIPVVLGPSRKNYERFLPPKAFIHVDDFPTVQELANYLLMLSRNPALTKRHLGWRGRYSLVQPSFWSEHYCTACRAVRRNMGRTNMVIDLARWFRS